MRKTLSIILSILSLTLMAQAPQGVGYQGVATDVNGIELINQSISIRASVLSGSANGTIQWEETHATTTDTFGLFSLTIGQGASTGNGAQTSFADISWGTNTHYLKIEMDVNGGSNYLFMGTNQMMSVPYALYAENANIDYDSISNYLSGDSTFLASFNSNCNTFGEPIESQAQWISYTDTSISDNDYRTEMSQFNTDGILVINFGSTDYGINMNEESNGVYYGADTNNMHSTFVGVLQGSSQQMTALTIPVKKYDYYFLVSRISCVAEIIFFPFECGNSYSSSSSSSLDSTTIANMIANSAGGNMAFGDIIPLDPNWITNPNDTIGFISSISEMFQVESDGFLILNSSNLYSNTLGEAYCVYYGADTNNMIAYCNYQGENDLVNSLTLPLHKDYFYFLSHDDDASSTPSFTGYFIPLESGGGSSSTNNNGSQLNIATREFSTSFSALTASDTIYISELIGDTVDRLSVEIIDVVWSSVNDQDVILGLYSNDNSLTTNYGQVEIRGDLNGETVLQGYPRSPSSSGAKAMKKLMISADNPYLLFTPYSYIGTGGSGVITFWITTTF